MIARAQDSNAQRDYLVWFDHYTRTENAGGINEMHPNWIGVKLSLIARIEECGWLNEQIQKDKIKVLRRKLDHRGDAGEEQWWEWRRVIKRFYEISLENNVSYVISNKTREEIIHLMEKSGITQHAIYDYENENG